MFSGDSPATCCVSYSHHTHPWALGRLNPLPKAPFLTSITFLLVILLKSELFSDTSIQSRDTGHSIHDVAARR